MYKKTCYNVFSGPDNWVKVKTRKSARKAVRRLLKKNTGYNVVCDHECRTKRKFSSERLYNSREDYPLNKLGV